MLEDLGEDVGPVPLTNVNESVLRKVIEWCEHHKNDPVTSDNDDAETRRRTTDIDEWDQKFMQVDQEMLFEIILVRRYIYQIYSLFFIFPQKKLQLLTFLFLFAVDRLPITWILRLSSTSAARPSLI